LDLIESIEPAAEPAVENLEKGMRDNVPSDDPLTFSFPGLDLNHRMDIKEVKEGEDLVSKARFELDV